MKNIKYIINITPFLIIIFAMFYLNIFSERKENISVLENRKLADMPKFSLQTLKSGEYFAGLDAYISDNFYMREAFAAGNRQLVGLINTNAFADKSVTVFIRPASEDEAAVALKDDNVFFVSKNDKDIIREFCSVINDYKARVKNLEINVLVSPTRYEFIDDKKIKENDKTTQEDALNYAKSCLDVKINYIDVYDTLFKHKNEYTFFKTDHHWTSLGAYYAYREFALSRGLTPIDLEQNPLKDMGEFTGSFLNLTNDERVSNIKDSISIYVPKIKYNCFYDWEKSQSLTKLQGYFDTKNINYKIFLGGDYGFTKIETENKKGESVLIIKDSYANALVQYLVEHYRKIIIVDPRYFKENIIRVIDKESINSVLFINNIETLSNLNFINDLKRIVDTK